MKTDNPVSFEHSIDFNTIQDVSICRSSSATYNTKLGKLVLQLKIHGSKRPATPIEADAVFKAH